MKLFIIVLTLLLWIIPGAAQETGILKDSRDGKIYKTVKIGNQWWMAENLTWLPSVSDPDDGSYDDPYYYIYGYKGTNVLAAKETDIYEIYGVLYNWEAAKTACPSDWHLPSDKEWKTLEMYLGMSSSRANKTGWRGTDEGCKLKEISTVHWNSPNIGSTNSNGFSALPGGYRYSDGSYSSIGYNAYFWCSTEYNSYYAWYRALHYKHSKIRRFCGFLNKRSGFSVRCLGDRLDNLSIG